MKTAVLATICFNDYQIISWHLMGMNISELCIAKNTHLSHLLKRYAEEHQSIPISIIDLDLSKTYPLHTDYYTFLESFERLVVFWNGKHPLIADVMQLAREMGKEVSVVFSYPSQTFAFAKAVI